MLKKNLLDQNRGASLTGYGLIVGLIAILAIAAVSNVGDSVKELFGIVDLELTGVASEGGGGSGGAQETPASFDFTDLTDQPLNALVTSNIVQITGITTAQDVSASGDGSPDYRVCSDATCDTVVSDYGAGGQVSDGQYLQFSMTSANAATTARVVTVNVGAGSDTWTVTTGDIERFAVVFESSNLAERPFGMTQTQDGGFVIVGTAATSPDALNTADARDAMIMKIDHTGAPVWAKTLDYGSRDDHYFSVTEASGGALYIVGYYDSSATEFNGLFAKFSSSGEHLFSRTYGGTESMSFADVEPLSNGNFWIVGNDLENNNVLLIQVDSNGDLVSGASRVFASGARVQQGGIASDGAGNLYISFSYNSTRDMGIARFDSNGDFNAAGNEWAKYVSQSDDDVSSDVAVGPGGRVASAVVPRTGSNRNMGMLGFDTDGSNAVLTQFSSGTGLNDRARSIVADGSRFLIAGQSEGLGTSTGIDSFFQELNPDGTVNWTIVMDQSGSEAAITIDIAQDGDILVMFNDDWVSNSSAEDWGLMKTDSSGLISGCSALAAVSPSISRSTTETIANLSATSSTVTPSDATNTPPEAEPTIGGGGIGATYICTSP